MIDDDTYLFKSNLHLMLSEYNSSLPYYMGKVKLFGGCGGFQFSTSPLFVHGGAGIILSRGALLQMLPILDTCISKYRDCHFGDVKTGLCLLDAGVKARAMDGFNDEMRGLNEGLEHACLPPITYHHLTPALITRLWNLEMQKALTEKTHVLTADIYSTIIKMPLDDAMHAEQDLQGMDFSDYPSKGALECQASCLEKPECTAFTDDGRWCWLKTGGVPRPISKLGCTSGMISSHFVCHESPKPLSFLTDISFL